MAALWTVAVALAALAVSRVQACSTLVAAKGATSDGSILAAHSNDGDGDTAGNLVRVPAGSWPAGARRAVSGGSIPQVAATFAYFTKAGGYASLNEFQVGLAESTCNGVLKGNSSGLVNIVDLSALALERTNSSRAAVVEMGRLATTFGYNDNAESLLVVDPSEAFVFHVLPDDTARSAVWVAQRVPDGHVGVVANSFTIRAVNCSDSHAFLHSANMVAVAERAGLWNASAPEFDFTRVFSGPEMGHRYSSGRRMWMAYKLLAPEQTLSPEYGDYVQDAPYPATLEVLPKSVDLARMVSIMRNSYQNTTFDMTAGLAAGAFGSPDRWAPGTGEAAVPGSWERTIAIVRTIVSYVVQVRAWLPRQVGATLWFAPHAAHTSCYVPLPAGLGTVPAPYTNNSLSRVDRGRSAWQASRFVFNIAQLKFSFMIQEVQAAQRAHEGRSLELRDAMDQRFLQHPGDWAEIEAAFDSNAREVVAAWWDLSDSLILHYADGYCNGCGLGPRHLGYPAWWLRAVNYSHGPSSD